MALPPHGYLLRYGELALKRRNRKVFEQSLKAILEPRLQSIDGSLEMLHKKIVVTSPRSAEAVRRALSTVFGITGISPIWKTGHDLEGIVDLAWDLVKDEAGTGKSFAVRTRRAHKGFPHTSIEMDRMVSQALFSRGLDLPVNLKKPELRLGISIEMNATWIYLDTWPGLGGLPVQPRNRCLLLLSGGLDSPVAGHLIQKRGGHLDALYFHTPPYTVEAAREKVFQLAQVLSRYQNELHLHVVDFTRTMKTLLATCDARYSVILSRRCMMRVACRLAHAMGGLALVTGESLGQVASQTLENIGVINQGTELPILRPLIGMDKREIMDLAMRLGTYDISIQPAQDCCSLFSPNDPVTRANLRHVLRMESRLDLETLGQQDFESIQTTRIQPQWPADPA